MNARCRGEGKPVDVGEGSVVGADARAEFVALVVAGEEGAPKERVWRAGSL